MASAGGNRLAAARLSAVAAASRLPPATTRSQSSYTTPGDTTLPRPNWHATYVPERTVFGTVLPLAQKRPEMPANLCRNCVLKG